MGCNESKVTRNVDKLIRKTLEGMNLLLWLVIVFVDDLLQICAEAFCFPPGAKGKREVKRGEQQ